jgi:galactitol-specific phosphotransferase system IIB component
MFEKFGFALCVVAIAGQVLMAQNSAGNILSGDVKAEVLKRYSGLGALPKPDKILIQDFAVPAGETTTDESIAARLHRTVMLRHGVDEDSSPQVLAQQLQAAFAKTLAGELKKVNIQTVNIPSQQISSAEGHVDGSDLVVAGEFVAINEGDETKRIMIGFGRGASDIKTHVTVSTVTQGHPTVVLELNLSSESGKKPGAVATMGVGSLAVGAAAGGVSDRKSKVEADASRMAKLVAKQLEAFMADQKWISNTPSTAPAGQ